VQVYKYLHVFQLLFEQSKHHKAAVPERSSSSYQSDELAGMASGEAYSFL